MSKTPGKWYFEMGVQCARYRRAMVRGPVPKQKRLKYDNGRFSCPMVYPELTPEQKAISDTCDQKLLGKFSGDPTVLPLFVIPWYDILEEAHEQAEWLGNFQPGLAIGLFRDGKKHKFEAWQKTGARPRFIVSDDCCTVGKDDRWTAHNLVNMASLSPEERAKQEQIFDAYEQAIKFDNFEPGARLGLFPENYQSKLEKDSKPERPKSKPESKLPRHQADFLHALGISLRAALDGDLGVGQRLGIIRKDAKPLSFSADSLKSKAP